MHSFVLQDWVTIRGASTVSLITQSASDYLDLEDYQDAVIWTQVAEHNPGGGSGAGIVLQSSPIKEEPFFSAGNTQPIFLNNLPAVYVSPLIWNDSPPANSFNQIQVPLSRYLRWSVLQFGATSAWDMTFRILVAAHSPSLSAAAISGA